MVEKIAIVGTGLIGRAWAISFARGGFDVALWVQTIDGVVAPPDVFTNGRRQVRIRVTDGAGFERTFDYQLLGPHGRAGPDTGSGS